MDAYLLNALHVGYFFILLSSAVLLKINFLKITLSGVTIRVSNSLDPDQARRFSRPDLVPNSLQRLSAGDSSRQRVIVTVVFEKINCLQDT